jgi:tetratricopeptide (TPR) repeat protein
VGDRLLAMGVYINARPDDQIVREDDSVEVTHEWNSQDREALGARHKAIFETVHKQAKPKEADETHVRALEEPMEDLDKAIEAAQQVVQSTPLADRLNKLNNWLARRRERTGEMKDLEDAIDTARRAVRSTPPNHRNLAASLYNLGIWLWRHFKRSGEMKDLDEAIDIARRAGGLKQ